MEPKPLATTNAVVSSNATHQTDLQQQKIAGAIGIITGSPLYVDASPIPVYHSNGEVLTTLTQFGGDNILALKCLHQTATHYAVWLEDQQLGYLPKNSDQIQLQTWEQHILTVFAVSFNSTDNPIRSRPDVRAEKSPTPTQEVYYYMPHRIMGSWLQLKYGPENDRHYGWIQWKSGETLLIDLHYFA
ncbi:hypothetical protein [Flavobacterium sp. JP2137]|uniref:hypothetical protein n=1 Tax=Flavobacterium sp. JP2137 TaxID=3414510 RepID=UPI003D2FD5CD